MNVSIDDNEVKTSDGGKDINSSMIEKENYHRIEKLLICLRFSDKFSLLLMKKKSKRNSFYFKSSSGNSKVAPKCGKERIETRYGKDREI